MHATNYLVWRKRMPITTAALREHGNAHTNHRYDALGRRAEEAKNFH